MTPFRERNPVVIGAISLLVMAAMVMLAFRAEDLPLIGGGDTYYAAFTEAGGLKPNDEVRVAGVRVGKVEDITLSGGHVEVRFLVDRGVRLGSTTGASIRIKTLLGQMYLALAPAGPGRLPDGARIPVSRTTAPFGVVQAFNGLASRSRRIDTGRLSTALDTLSALGRNTPDEVRASLRGLSALSRNIAARDHQINTLLGNLEKVSSVLGDRDQQFARLFADGGTLFRAVYQRRVAIHRLLLATDRLSRQLTGLVRDSRADLRPALSHLANVVQVLQRNQAQLDNSLRLMAPFYKVFANTLSNGPWFDTYVQNIPPVPAVGGTGH